MAGCPAPACGPAAIGVSRTQTVGLHKCALWGYRGRRPDVNTLCFKGRGIRRIVSRSLARQYLTSRGAGLAERGACCAPDKPVFSVCVCAVFVWCRLLAQVACWGEPARHCGPPVPIGRTGFAWLQCKYVLTFTGKIGRSAGQVPPGHREDTHPHVTDRVP